MIKISIKKFERALGLKIKKNVYSVGVDTAATTGFAVIKVTDKEIEIQYDIFKLPSIPRKLADQLEKAEKYEQQLDSMSRLINEMKQKYLSNFNEHIENNILVIEQSYMFNNPETYGILRAEQGLVYESLNLLFSTVRIWLATTARKLVGFQTKLQRSADRRDKKKEIMKWVSNVIELELKDDNIADAILLAIAGIIA